MIKRYFILLSLTTVLLLNSCETTEKIDDFPLRPSKLVVNCYFAEDSIWKFQVSKSLSVLDNANLKILDNAAILLFKGEEFLDTINKIDEDSWYRYADHLPKQGETYSIEVSSPDFVSVLHAEDYVPHAVPVSDVSVTIRDSSYTYERYYDWGSIKRGQVEGVFEVLFHDPPQVENYYQLSFYTYETDYDYIDSTFVNVFKRSVSVSLEDASLEDVFFSGDDLLISDLLFDGQNYKVNFEFHEWDVAYNQEYFVELTSLNRTGYLYKKSISDYQMASGDPFSEPVRIYCNIENGYGIFTGYSTNTYSFTIK